MRAQWLKIVQKKKVTGYQTLVIKEQSTHIYANQMWFIKWQESLL